MYLFDLTVVNKTGAFFPQSIYTSRFAVQTTFISLNSITPFCLCNRSTLRFLWYV